ncbi:hypothetical protein B0H14DRAFT_2656584 [Mycena olivaceomarginata]|nr:hypothetical protein B0H14DRAFT_2656584 [Mycena olivaceomarginata]
MLISRTFDGTPVQARVQEPKHLRGQVHVAAATARREKPSVEPPDIAPEGPPPAQGAGEEFHPANISPLYGFSACRSLGDGSRFPHEATETKKHEEVGNALKAKAKMQSSFRSFPAPPIRSFPPNAPSLPPLDDDGGGYEGDVLRGHAAADISHAGEWIDDEEAEQADEDLVTMLQEHQSKTSSRRPRNRRNRIDRTQNLVDMFAAQLDAMTDAYMS